MSCEERRKAKVNARQVEEIEAAAKAELDRVVSLPQVARREEHIARQIGLVCRQCDTLRKVVGVDLCGDPSETGEITLVWGMLRTKGQSCRFGKHAETLRRLGVE